MKVKTKFKSDKELAEFAEVTFDEKVDYDLKVAKAKQKALDAQYHKLKQKEKCQDPDVNSDGSKSASAGDNSIISMSLTNKDGKTTATINTEDPIIAVEVVPDPVIENVLESQNNPEVKSTNHHNTIRRYTAGLISFFSNLETEYVDEKGTIYTKKLPVIYGNREKLEFIKQHDWQALFNGNVSYLPRAAIFLDSLTYDQNRQQNSNNTYLTNTSYNTLKGANPYAEVVQAPAPYNLAYRLNIVTRGMNMATMLIEQICSVFTPKQSFKMVEVENGNETNVTVLLEGVTVETPEYDEYSNNEVTVEVSLMLYGNLFQPIQKEQLITTINLDLNTRK